jgi:hypothetical protein
VIHLHQIFLFPLVLGSYSSLTMFIVTEPMFGTRLPGRDMRGEFTTVTCSRGLASLLAGIALLCSPSRMVAQRGGGVHIDRPVICVYDCPNTEGRSSIDDLKDFRRAIAAQATPEQRAAFTKVAQYTAAAGDRLKDFRESLPMAPASSPLADRAAELDQAITRARAGNQNFLASLSAVQKSGLKNIINTLEKADSEVVKQVKALDPIILNPKPDSERIASISADLDKTLNSFRDAQLALGGEMSILFPAAGQNVAFSLPQVTNPIDIAGQSIAIPAAGAISRASSGTTVENGENLFDFTLVADLSDVQQNITGLLRPAVNRSPRCGERIEMLEASLIPVPPAGQVTAHLHLEHWICPPGPSGQDPTELAAGDGEIEIKLTPTIDRSGGMTLASETSRVQADSFFRELLRSGEVGVKLREQITATLLSALQKGADVKAALPPVAKELATLQKAQFENNGADQLSFVLDGQLRFSDEQAQQFTNQLNQRLSARQTSQ